MRTIARIEINNFKCHNKITVVFSDGVTTFVAPNGWGKSSLTQAIAWCLFGPSAVPANQDSLVRKGAEECSIIVDLWLDGEYYQFVRKYSRGAAGTRAMVYSHGELLADKSTGVAEFLKNKGIDLDGFNMIYAEQGELSFFIHASPALRKQVVSSLFQIDKLDTVIQAVRQTYKEVAAEIDELPSQQDYDDGCARAQQFVRDMDIDQQRLAESQNELVEVQGALEAEEDNLKKLPEIQENSAKIAAIRAAILACQDEAVDIEKRTPVVCGIGRSREEVDTLSETFQGMVEDLQGLRQQLHDQKGVLERLKTHCVSFEDGVCPTCGTSGEIIFKLMGQNQQEISTAIHSINSFEGKEKELVDAVALAQEELIGAREEIKSVQMWEDSGAESRLVILQEKILDYEDILSELLVAKEMYPVIDIDKIDVLQKKAADLRDSKFIYTQNIGMSKRKIAAHTTELVEIEESRARALGLQRKVKSLEKLRKVISLFRGTTLSQSLEWVAHRTSALLTTATQEPWELSIDTDLQFWVEDILVKHHSSGQIDLICVCIRIAIAEYLSNRIGFKGLLILDGVFDRIDEANRDAVGRLISEVNLSQIIILSHFQVPVIGGKEIRLR